MNVFRVVLDTNVFVSALLSPSGNPAKIYRMFLSGALDLVVNTDILAEYEDVLFRPRLQLPAIDVKTVLDVIRRYAETVRPLPGTDAMIDEDDRVFYDTAKSAGAYLITGNIKHYPQEAFILTPTEFLSLI